MPLNTGYNHSQFQPYPSAGIPSGIADNYWINIASYLTTSPPIGPSWVLQTPTPPWAPAFPNTHWISAWKTAVNPAVPPFQYPAYTIFRKCFCLSPNFKNASLSFRVRGDDNIQVWFNSVVNTALAPVIGNWSPNLVPRTSLASSPNWFKVGRNCIYVLLEDTGVHMGFDMVGSIQADGLAEQPAMGVEQTFPCACRDSIPHTQASVAEEQQVVRQIVSIAEARLANRLAMQAPATRDAASSLLRATPWLQTRLLTNGWSRRPRA